MRPVGRHRRRVARRRKAQGSSIRTEITRMNAADVESLILPPAIEDRDDPVVSECLKRYPALTAAFMDVLPFPSTALQEPQTIQWVLQWREKIKGSWRTSADEQRAFFRAVRQLYCSGELLPVAGAGVSRPAGFPLWGELTKLCLEYAERACQKTHPEDVPKVRAALSQLNSERYTDKQLKEATDAFVTAAHGDASVWLQDILEACYKRLPEPWAPIAPTRLHDSLAALHHSARPSDSAPATGPMGPGIRGIVTYNFDQMLELAMANRNSGVEVYFSKHGEAMSLLIGDIRGDYPFPIVHAHGFIPAKPEPVRPPNWAVRPDVVPAHDANSVEEVRRHDLVFSQSSYELLYADHDGLPRIVHSEMFGRTGALFLGCSLEDDAVLRELLEAKEESPLNAHYAVFQDKDNVLDDPKAYAQTRDRYLHYGIRPCFIRDHDLLPRFLEQLRKEGEKHLRGLL